MTSVVDSERRGAGSALNLDTELAECSLVVRGRDKVRTYGGDCDRVEASSQTVRGGRSAGSDMEKIRGERTIGNTSTTSKAPHE
jgi:hypothetical protein